MGMADATGAIATIEAVLMDDKTGVRPTTFAQSKAPPLSLSHITVSNRDRIVPHGDWIRPSFGPLMSVG